MTTCAVFTLQRDEIFHLPQWLSYYSRHFAPHDLYVLDHDSQDPRIAQTLRQYSVNIQRLSNDVIFDHDWLLSVVHGTQRELLERYDYVLFTDTDEIVIPLHGTLREFIAHATEPAYRCTGYEVIENGMVRNVMYDKTLLASHPLEWCYGYHTASPDYAQTSELLLYHLHRWNRSEAWEKNLRWARSTWDPQAIRGGHSIQNQITDEDQFNWWFYNTGGQVPLEHDVRIAAVLDTLRGVV